MLELIKCNLNNNKQIYNNVMGLYNPDENEYIISYNDNYVGALKLNKELNNYYSIDIGIKEKFRNLGIGTEVLKKIKYIINDLNWNTILLRTSHDNISAIKSFLEAGFILDDEENEKCEKEGVNYIVFSITNSNQKVKKYQK